MENLGIDVKLLLAQIVNFALFFFLFQKFIAASFLKFINEEKQKEKEKERILSALKTKEEEMSKKEDELKEKMRKETEKILLMARSEANKLKEGIIAQAKKEADDLREKMRQQMKDEREAMYKEIKEKIIDLSVDMVDRALEEYLTEKTRKELTQHILKNLPQKVIKYEA